MGTPKAPQNGIPLVLTPGHRIAYASNAVHDSCCSTWPVHFPLASLQARGPRPVLPEAPAAAASPPPPSPGARRSRPPTPSRRMARGEGPGWANGRARGRSGPSANLTSDPQNCRILEIFCVNQTGIFGILWDLWGSIPNWELKKDTFLPSVGMWRCRLHIPPHLVAQIKADHVEAVLVAPREHGPVFDPLLLRSSAGVRRQCEMRLPGATAEREREK